MAVRLLPRTLPEMYAYLLAIQREATKRYAQLEGFLRATGVEHIADEFERIGREEREQYDIVALGTSGAELPELAGWELSWHFAQPGEGGEPESVRQAVAMALALERRTQAFYIDVAENADNGAVRAFAAEMATGEQRQLARLEALALQTGGASLGPELLAASDAG